MKKEKNLDQKRVKNQNNPLAISKVRASGRNCQCNPSVIGKAGTSGITLVALVVTVVVNLVSYDKNGKYSNLVGFSL